MEETLEKTLKEEEELRFKYFNEDTAWQLGALFVEESIKKDLPVTVDIMRGDQQLFHASRPGTSADNDEWIKRKTRLVRRVGHSSFYINQLLKHQKKTLEEKYFISSSKFAPYGGCFPIKIKNCGIIGTITVSGLSQEDDHDFAVQTIRKFLNLEK